MCLPMKCPLPYSTVAKSRKVLNADGARMAPSANFKCPGGYCIGGTFSGPRSCHVA